MQISKGHVNKLLAKYEFNINKTEISIKGALNTLLLKTTNRC
jgi:hypothetical protein